MEEKEKSSFLLFDFFLVVFLVVLPIIRELLKLLLIVSIISPIKSLLGGKKQVKNNIIFEREVPC